MKRSHAVMLGLAASLSLAVAGAAQADPNGVKVGVLTCNVSSGWGLVFGSSRELNCTFSPTEGAKVEEYKGKINKYGVDIGYHNGGIMAWAVFAPAEVRPGALAGGYGGVTASATAGVGAGANVLVGGGDKSVSLQPLSLEGNTGLNLAAGVASIDLAYKP